MFCVRKQQIRSIVGQFTSFQSFKMNKQRIYHYDEITSTMDQAKELLKTNELQSTPSQLFSVLANCQSQGRGTHGRSWISLRGNLLLTVCFQMKDVPISMSLLPLRIGHIVCCSIEDILLSHQSVTTVDIKWPNDILIDNKKMCGVLIECEKDTFVIGIGCNLMTTPSVDKFGPESGRDATCLQDHLNLSQVSSEKESDEEKLYYLRDLLATNIISRISHWLEDKTDCNERVIKDCSSKMTYMPQRLRVERIRGMNREEIESFTSVGDEVRPLQLNNDGTLQVQHCRTNREMTLSADYLW